jgi:hypothetical protein
VGELAAQYAPLAEKSQSSSIRLSKITKVDDAKTLFRDRRPSGSVANSLFDSGDHYQNGKGYIGAKPLLGDDGYSQILLQIKEGFVSENVIKEIIDRHIAGLLGREPLWGFLPSDVPSPQVETRRKLFSKLFNIVRNVISPVAGDDKSAQDADDALTIWWNNRKVRKTLKQVVRTALLEERATIRFFFPEGLTNDQGQVAVQSDLISALTIPQIEVLTSDKAGIFVDAGTQQEFGVYIYKTEDNKDAAWLTYVDKGQTILRIMVEDKPDQNFSYDLGGRLLMYELERDALITEQIRSLQKSLNLARTMMVRNVNLAGSLERTIMNAEKPENWLAGPGKIMGLTGLIIRNDNGEVINRANPSISFHEPTSTKTFTETRDDLYAAMLGGCQQRYALISGDATASGKSRIEARSEFETSLKDSKDGLDDLGRWLLETQLRIGATLSARGEFLELRADFNAVIETGEITPEERDANRNDVKAGLMSKETAMSRNGVDDTDAELERIAQEPQPTPINPSQPGQQPPLIG